jgi:trimethylguanosine synthase
MRRAYNEMLTGHSYFRHRYNIWSKYDDGIWMTDNAWYGVSQELVAAKIAQHVAVMTPSDKSILIDAFCGVGGNTIAFALSGRWKRVYAIEKDAATLECARRNAEIYGVRDKITWFLGDCFELLGTGKNAVEGLRELVAEYGIIFGSPPWGGKDGLDQ